MQWTQERASGTSTMMNPTNMLRCLTRLSVCKVIVGSYGIRLLTYKYARTIQKTHRAHVEEVRTNPQNRYRWLTLCPWCSRAQQCSAGSHSTAEKFDHDMQQNSSFQAAASVFDHHKPGCHVCLQSEDGNLPRILTSFGSNWESERVGNHNFAI